MVHRKILGNELADKVESLNIAELRALLAFILVILSEKGHLTKKQRKSLAITERQLKIRRDVEREKSEIHPKKKRRGPPKGKVPPHLRKYLFKKGHKPPRRHKKSARK